MQSGRVKLLGVASARRSILMPEVATIAEQVSGPHIPRTPGVIVDVTQVASYPTYTVPVIETSDFSVGPSDVWLINNKSGSTCTATLPTASTNTGRVLHFQNYQDQTLVSASSNVVSLVGGAATTAILSAVAGDTCTLVSDGSNWVMTQYTPNNVLLI